MKEKIATQSLLFSNSIEIKNGDVFYYQDGPYLENWQSWTICLYKKESEQYKRIGIVTCGEFSRQLQTMQDKNIK